MIARQCTHTLTHISQIVLMYFMAAPTHVCPLLATCLPIPWSSAQLCVVFDLGLSTASAHGGHPAISKCEGDHLTTLTGWKNLKDKDDKPIHLLRYIEACLSIDFRDTLEGFNLGPC